MAHKRTVLWFEEWVRVPENVEGFFRLMEERDVDGRSMRFRDACVEREVPYTLMHKLVNGSQELRARYDAVLAANAEALVEEALDDVAGAKDRDTAAAAKVKADTKLKVASKWDQERYGERVQVTQAAKVPGGDEALLGFASELLKLVRAREPRVLEAQREALPASVGDGSL
jgi:hypothetical protein